MAIIGYLHATALRAFRKRRIPAFGSGLDQRMCGWFGSCRCGIQGFLQFVFPSKNTYPSKTAMIMLV